MKRLLGTSAALLALMLLTMGALGVSPAAATEVDSGEGALVGKLTTNDNGQYVLVEVESGDQFLLEGEGLDEHVDANVEVIGEWQSDEDGNRYFAVTSIRALD